jgi:hypothetical protein
MGSESPHDLQNIVTHYRGDRKAGSGRATTRVSFYIEQLKPLSWKPRGFWRGRE